MLQEHKTMAQLMKPRTSSPFLGFEQVFRDLNNRSPQCFNANNIEGRCISGGVFSHLMEQSFIHECPVQSTSAVTVKNRVRNIRAKFNQNFSGFITPRIDGKVNWCNPKCGL